MWHQPWASFTSQSTFPHQELLKTSMKRHIEAEQEAGPTWQPRGKMADVSGSLTQSVPHIGSTSIPFIFLSNPVATHINRQVEFELALACLMHLEQGKDNGEVHFFIA